MSKKFKTWRHPQARKPDELTRGEKAADTIREIMGSWGFVIAFTLFLIGWMIGNGRHGFDPFPFILLNLVLSCMAAMQGAILLIAGRRSEQISSEIAEHDYNTDQAALKHLEEIKELLKTNKDLITKEK